MSRKCDLIDDCRYFLLYQEDRSSVIDVWKKLFCMDGSYSKKCRRKQIFGKTGEVPPDNMSPIGELLGTPDD